MPLHLFRNKIFAGANLLTFFLYPSLAGAMLFLTLNMVQIQGYSQLQAGMTLLPFTILLILISRWSGRLVDKYGPRWFLILGPLTVAVGLLSLSFVKETGGPSSYWSTYFPGIVLFGLGMSFTVTPLTATVMNAVAGQHSGTASGINNAISRVANVFANAILGALAILFFTGYLTKGIGEASLPQTIQQKIISQASDLWDAKVPSLVKTENVAKVKQLYKEGFINAYVKIMRICAVLALVASFTAFVFIKNEKLPGIADNG